MYIKQPSLTLAMEAVEGGILDLKSESVYLIQHEIPDEDHASQEEQLWLRVTLFDRGMRS